MKRPLSLPIALGALVAPRVWREIKVNGFQRTVDKKEINIGKV